MGPFLASLFDAVGQQWTCVVVATLEEAVPARRPQVIGSAADWPTGLRCKGLARMLMALTRNPPSGWRQQAA